MTFDLASEVRRLNGVGDPLIFRIMLVNLLATHGRDRVASALINEAARAGAISIAFASLWMRPNEPPRRKVG
jgi:hypothetical protein